MSVRVDSPRPAATAWPREVDAILTVSRAVADGSPATSTLDQIATVAVSLTGAAAAIVLRSVDSESGLAVAAAHDLSDRYVHFLNYEEPLEVGKGVSGKAVATEKPVPVDDVETEPLIAPWRDVLLGEGYRSVISVPLCPAERNVIGVLNVYREHAGPWRDADVRFLRVLADHAAIAIRISHLLTESRQQLDGLSLIVQSLRAQAHEHSNRLHAIHGLLWLGEYEQAERLVAEIEEGYHTSYGTVTGRIKNAVLAGFLVSEEAVARQSGIDLRIDRRSRLDELPPGLSDLDAVTIVGNLLHNAIDAVGQRSDRRRRRVAVAILQDPQEVVIRVRDWGSGVPDEALVRMFAPGFSTKEGHAGIGLTLVRGIVQAAGGAIDARRSPGGGAVVTVRFPR